MISMRDAMARLAPQQFAGAPLDVVKLVAALLMVVDHVNAIFLGNRPTLLWHLGRIVFPLFAFALVCNLRRGTDVGKYLASLLVLGAVSQPIFAGAFGDTAGNTLLTLAVGIAIVVTLRDRSPLVQHAALAIGAIAVFSPGIQARTGVDFGLAGMMLPAALYVTLHRGIAFVPWLLALLVGLNWFPPEPWRYAPILTATIAGVGALAVLAGALRFQGRPRFLPRYALHIFYPAHLLALWVGHGLLAWAR